MKLPQLKGFKKKEKPIKVPKRKTKSVLSYQTVRRFLLGGVIFVGVLFIVGMIRLFVATETIQSLHKQIGQLNAQVETLQSDERINIDDKAFHFFMGDFLKQFITVDSGVEGIENRKNNLKKYYSNGVIQTENPNAATRQYKQSVLIRVQTDNKPYKAIYQVVYTITQPVEKKTGTETTLETKTVDVVNYLVVPFVSHQGQFSIVSEPYFTAKPNVVLAHDVTLTQHLTGQTLMDKGIERELNVFLNNFISKYAVGNVEDLKYMMSEPKGLDNRFTVEKIENVSFVSTGDNQYKGIAKVYFVDKDTYFTHVSKMIFDIEKVNDKYQVTTLDYIN